MVDLVLEPRNLASETVFLLQHHTDFTFTCKEDQSQQ